MWVIAHFSMLFDLPPAAAGEERSKWGHPTPRQRTASSALLPIYGSGVAEILYMPSKDCVLCTPAYKDYILCTVVSDMIWLLKRIRCC